MMLSVKAYAQQTNLTLQLYSKQQQENVPFQVTNMFPGDKEIKNYCIQVTSNESITVRFHVDIEEQYEKLAEVLKCKVNLLNTGEVLYDGLMNKMPESLDCYLKKTSNETKELNYEITAYLDTDVGNDYMGKSLVADFCWWVCSEEEKPSDTSDKQEATQDEVISSDAKTFDANHLYIWFGIAVGSFFVMILFNGRNRSGGKRYE